MSILWIIDGLGPGGAESLMVPLLSSLKERNVESRVCVLQVKSGNPIGEELRKLGVPVDLLPIKNLRNPLDLFRLVKYIRQHRPDVIHTQLETSDALGTIAARLLNIPSVSTLHTLEQPSTRKRKRWRNMLRWNSLNMFANRVIAVSEVAHRHYISLGFRSEKIITLYNGIDIKRFRTEHLPSKTDIYGLPNDSTVITTVAVLREPKGIQYMLHALPDMINKVPNLYYAVVGDGPYHQNLEQLASSLGIKDRVVFMGYRSNIPEILAASDVFVLPTLVDALPTVLFEAMAAGLPIIVSNVGGVPEIVEDEVNGLLIPPADPASLATACIRLLLDEALCNRLSSAARATVASRFDVGQQAGFLLALYNQMVTI